MDVRLLTVDEFVADLPSILEDNFSEVRPGEQQQLNVDFFRQSEKNGLLFIVGAIQGGRIVGYSVTFVTADIHSASVLASNDVIYLDPAYRLGMTALRLIRATEEEALRRGAAFMSWNPLVGTGLTKLLERRGYAARSVTYRKEL